MSQFEIESIIKLFVATALGAMIGLERGMHGRPAGMRTHALVCLASSLLIIISRTGALSTLDPSSNLTFNIDPARMGAGIVTGIGFLGAGAILRIRESLVRGLTTAACIWFVAAIGMAVGFDAYGLAVVATLIAIILLTLLDRLEGAMASVVYRTLSIDVDAQYREEIEQTCKALLKQNKMRVQQVEYEVNNRKEEAKLSFSVRLSSKHETPYTISKVAALKGIRQIKWF